MKRALLMIVLGLFAYNGCSFSGSYNPYAGSLAELMPRQVRSGVSTFNMQNSSPNPALQSEIGATDLLQGNYMMQAAGTRVGVVHILANYPSAEAAEAAFQRAATRLGATPARSARGNGQRYTTNNGKGIVWTNGSLLCMVSASTEQPAESFEAGLSY